MRKSQQSRIALALAIAGILALATLARAQKNSALFSQDKGKFTIQLNGQTIGHDDFEISPNTGGWSAQETTELKVPDSPATKVTGTLTLQADGAPVAYQWTSYAEKTNGANIVFTNGTAKITLQMQGARPFEQEMSFGTSHIAVLDNNLYYQYAVLARVYDWSKRGAQNFPVLIPQELTPGSVTLESTGSVTAYGKSYEALRVTTSDIEVILYRDAAHRLMRLEVPAAKVSVSRD